MKKYVFPHPVLLIEGQIFSLLLCFILLIFGYQTIFNFESIGIVGIIGIIVMIPAMIFWYKVFWQQIFGILKITEKHIVFFGLFLPPVKIKFEDVKYIDIRTFDNGNVMYNKVDNVDSYKFMLLSPNPLPSRPINKISTSRRKKLIKYAVSKKLCEALVDKLPLNLAKPVEYQLHLYNRKYKRRK